MPKLWSATIEGHRQDVRQAIIDTTAKLVHDEGLISVTMSRIAEKTGIGRATLYKYFSDIESILLAWHQRQINTHLHHLAAVRDQVSGARQRLEAVLEAYALVSHESRGHHDTELAAFLHRDQQVVQAEEQLGHMVETLLADAAQAGEIRNDLDFGELANYCLHALSAARALPSKAAVRRLVTMTMSGLSAPA